MVAREIPSRIQHRHDLEVNWQKLHNFIPMQAEIIVYDIEIDANGNVLSLPQNRTVPYTHPRFKIGDGKTTVTDLPFYLYDELNNINDDIKRLIQGSIFVTPQMYGAKGDGQTDDTAAIQAALDASQLVFIPDGVYLINATHQNFGDYATGGIQPHDGQTIILSSDAILKAITNSTSFYNIINMVGVNNVKITGGKIEGEKLTHNGTTGEFGYGIAIRACDNIVIDNVESFDCWGDSIFIGHTGETNSNNIKIYNCKLHGSRRQGISIVGGTNVVIRDCEIYDISGTLPQYGIDIEPDGDYGVAENIIIDGCYIHDCESGSIVMAKVTNLLRSIKITNCNLDTVTFLGGEDVFMDNSTINSRIGLGTTNTFVSNCYIAEIYSDGGGGEFDNCHFIGKSTSSMILIDVSHYPTIIKQLIFKNCHFKTYAGATYLIKTGGAAELVDGIFPVDTIEFIDCHIILSNGCLINSMCPTKKMIFDRCKINFQGSVYEVFGLRYSLGGTHLIVNNVDIECAGTATYLVTLEAHEGYEIEIINSKASTTYFLGGTTATESKATIRLFNNLLNNTRVVNANDVIFYPVSLTDTDKNLIIDTVINALPIYEGETS